MNSTDSQSVHGWTLIVPAGWGMPFFSSLTFTNTRVAGQFERQTQAYESGVPYFPRDYPSTAPYHVYASERADEEMATWERKPPAKRVNYEKLGTSDPWQPNWTKVLGIEAGSPELVTTQRGPLATSQAEGNGITTTYRPWLFRGSELPRILSNISSALNHGAALLSEVNRLRLKRGAEPLDSTVDSAGLLQSALVNVKLTMCLRGAPQDLAMIYGLSDESCRQWKKLIHNAKSSSNEETPEEIEVSGIPIYITRTCIQCVLVG